VSSNITFSGKENKDEDSLPGSYSLYLQAGEYTVVASTFLNETEYMSVKSLTVSDSIVLDIELYPKTHVTGRVFFDGREYTEELSIDFSSESGELIDRANTLAASYSVDLPPGSFVVEIDHATNATIDGLPKFVRYTFSETLHITEGLSEKTYNINLVRVFDNVTLSGRVLYQGQGTDAEATVLAISVTAVNTSFQSQPDGSFEISLTQGQYSLYIHKKEGHLVHLGLFDIQLGRDVQMDFNLNESHRVTGVATYRDGLTKRTLVSFYGNGIYDLESNGEGYFEVYLPQGYYEVSARTHDYEDGELTEYNILRSPLDVDGDEVISLTMEKDIVRDVELDWDSRQRRTIRGGESVTYRISIENTGNVPDQFEITGIPPEDGWTFKFKPAKISLGTGEQASSSFEATITAPQDALVEHGPVKIEATSVDDADKKGDVAVEIDIERTWGVELDASSIYPVYDGSYLDFYVNLTNSGNSPDIYYVEIINLEDLETDGWAVGLRNETSHQTAHTLIGFEVDANSTSTFGVRLIPPKKMMNVTVVIYSYSHENRGNDVLLSFDVSSPTADVIDEHMFAEGNNAHTEPLEDYVSYLIVGVVAAGLVAAFAYLRKRRRK
jgi:uncharacterized membrane protein